MYVYIYIYMISSPQRRVSPARIIIYNIIMTIIIIIIIIKASSRGIKPSMGYGRCTKKRQAERQASVMGAPPRFPQAVVGVPS